MRVRRRRQWHPHRHLHPPYNYETPTNYKLILVQYMSFLTLDRTFTQQFMR